MSFGLLDIFEFGHIFTGDIKSKYTEIEVVSGVFGGIKTKRQWDQNSETLTWFEGKGRIEELLKKFNFVISWKPSSLINYQSLLHPYRTAELWVSQNQSLGVFGQIHPVLAKKYGIPTDIFLFEFNLDTIKIEFQNRKLALYQPYSTYPRITKDLSFVVSREITFNQIEYTLLKNGSEYLKNIQLLDEYQGNSIPEDQTSLCIQLTFQSSEKTLITKEIEEIVSNLQILLEKEYNVVIRL